MTTHVVLLALIAALIVPVRAAPTPASVALEPAAKAAAELPRLFSLLVSWRGELVLERYFNGARAARPANIKSASKSVIAALVGIAIARGLIADVDRTDRDVLPGAAPRTRTRASGTSRSRIC